MHGEYGGLALTHRQERRQSRILFFTFRAAAAQLQAEAGSQPLTCDAHITLGAKCPCPHVTPGMHVVKPESCFSRSSQLLLRLKIKTNKNNQDKSILHHTKKILHAPQDLHPQFNSTHRPSQARRTGSKPALTTEIMTDGQNLQD